MIDLLLFLPFFLLGLAIGRSWAVPLAIGGAVVLAVVLGAVASVTDAPSGDFTVWGNTILAALIGSVLSAFSAALGLAAHQLLFNPRMPWSSKTRPLLGRRGA